MTAQTADPLAALTGEDITADDVAAAAEAHRQAAREATAQAERDQAEAERIMTKAEAEAARITREARQRAGELSQSARHADGRVADLEFRAQALQAAANAMTGAAAAGELAASLAAERELLAGKLAKLGGRLAELDADRQEAEAALAAALEDGDGGGMSAARDKIANAAAFADDARGKQAALAARLAAIGTGEAEVLPAGTPQKELAAALAEAERLRGDVTRNLHVASIGEQGAALEASRAAFAAEASRQPGAPQPRTQVYGPGVLG